MRFLADTSVLVAAFIPGHVHHERSFGILSAANQKSAVCAAHSLAEVYATTTRLPFKYRASAPQALTFLESIEERFSLISLDTMEYVRCIREAAARGVVGGTLYDALIAACAVKASVDTIYTWNVVHFLGFEDKVARRVQTP